ncbi:hypothetical protein [Marinicella gelatinilytica]|uniref:hypothetical protein n=1 Tax=Marinicella gelatinilytica TaxID=2996017 RepID=UPI002260D0DC|nr:hypothetical protein [Marinicella gelatinilytica]MCX7545791.1 hypothetical protein [Marinicella gelatinilytica]
MKIILLLVVAILAAFSGFVVHVFTVEWLPQWISTQMQGLEVKPSWDVRYVAAITSIEMGLGAVGLYYFGRYKFIQIGRFKSALLFSVLLLALNGRLIRQPLMDFVIGNPWHVALVQNAFNWLSWILMAFIVIYGYEYVVTLTDKKPLK